MLVRSFLTLLSMFSSTLPASVLWLFFFFTTLLALPLQALVKWTSGPIWHFRNVDHAPGSWETQLSTSFTKGSWVCLEGAELWYLEEQPDKSEWRSSSATLKLKAVICQGIYKLCFCRTYSHFLSQNVTDKPSSHQGNKLYFKGWVTKSKSLCFYLFPLLIS